MKLKSDENDKLKTELSKAKTQIESLIKVQMSMQLKERMQKKAATDEVKVAGDASSKPVNDDKTKDDADG